MFDVIVIGGGVIGGVIARELTKYKCGVCILEKANDVCMGQSKANSGIVHAGFDAVPGTLKARFNVAGNAMMPALAKELGVKYKNNGSLVVAFSDEEVKTLEELKLRGEKNGVPGLKILDRDALRMLEPNISDNAVAALYAPTAGIICPYELTIAAIGNAMDNGATLYTDFDFVSAKKGKKGFTVCSASGQKVEGRLVINCAGLNSGAVAAAFGDKSVNVMGRKGEYILLDRESGDFVSHTLFFTPTEKGKGILVGQTVDKNIILGPTSAPTDDPVPVTSAAGLDEVIEKTQEMCKNVPLYNAITSFCGIRAYCDRHDFIVEESKEVPGLINCAGIESPGLTSAPAIAKYVAEEIVCKKLGLKKNGAFNGDRTPDHYFKELSVEQKNEIIKREPAYGKIVCRCEQVTEGEILRVIHTNPPARSIDAVKRRLRAGMGRCQGGFCQPHVAEILAKELGVDFDKITKSGAGSELVVGKTK